MAVRANVSRLSDLKFFYELLDTLASSTGGRKSLKSLGAYGDWPNRGIYFFYDLNEPREESGQGARVVRVGTHALTRGSKSTLKQRLSQHRGNLSGGGNHRGSIFRLLVGQALLQSGRLPPCISWGVKSDKQKACEAVKISRSVLDTEELPIELAVSEYVASLSFLWLEIDDDPSPESHRGLIEQNSIALLSNHDRTPIDAASSEWLGYKSNRDLVPTSGLWNQRHVTAEYDPEFLNTMQELISSASLPS